MTKLLLTVPEAATALGISRSKLYELIKAGTIASKLARSDNSEWNRNSSGPSPDCAALTVPLARSLSMFGLSFTSSVVRVP